MHSAKGIEVSVMNPKAIRRFADAYLQRGKTDAMDAAVILEHLARMPFQSWQPPSEEVLELQYISRRISQLTKELIRERNRHLTAERLGVGRVVARDAEINVSHIERRIKAMEAAARELIGDTAELEAHMQQLCSIPGVAEKTGTRILAELSAMPEGMTSPQWVAHAGLDPRPNESGLSVHKPRRITKAGNHYLREALYYPVLVASQCEPHVKAFYEKLLAKGKKPMQALVAVMRKLLLAIWGMLKNGQNWQGERFYEIPNSA